MRGIYIGRFQIFHNGHLNVVKFMDKSEDITKIVIAVGSAQYSRFKEHPYLPSILYPFTFEERKEMLDFAFKDELSKPYEIIAVNDVHMCDIWAKQLIYLTNPGVIYTNTRKEIESFEKNNVLTRRFPVGGSYHAQVVREMIADKNNWQKYVPEGVKNFIENNNIETILGDFYAEHQKEINLVHNMQIRDSITPYNKNEIY